jgi:death-on-curing protein
VVRNRALVDGNTRPGLASVIAFYGMNGLRLTFTNDEACDLIVAVAAKVGAGELDEVSVIARRLEAGTEPWV